MAKMTGREALMDILHKEGVEYVFGIPGATEVLFIDALEKQKKIKYILCLHEVIAIGAAEGYARTSGRVGFVNLHTGCGLASSMGLLFNAHRGGVPLVVTSGQIDSHILLRDPHLSGQLVKMAEPLTKWSTEVLYADDIPMVMQRAFKMAQQQPTGPVFVSLPQDVLNQSLDYEHTDSMPVLTRTRPDMSAISEAAELLVKAKNPAILVENGVAKNDALHEVVKLAEQIGARVYQQWMSDVNFPNQHPLYMGEISSSDVRTSKILEPFDTLLVIGCQLFGQDKYVPVSLIAKHTKVIHIDDNPWEIAKNFPVNLGIQSNIAVAVAELTELLRNTMPEDAMDAAKARVSDITQETTQTRAAFLKQTEAEKDDTFITDANLILELRDAVKPGTLIVDDCWSTSIILRRILNLNDPKSFQRSRGGGSIGWGMPGALGTQLAAPNQPVVAICGDGSAIWSVQSMWTAANHNLPITYIVVANNSYRMVKYYWSFVLGGNPNDKHIGLEVENPVLDFCKMAEAMGIHGQKVERSKALGAALRSAMASGKPELIEVCTKKLT